MQSSRKHLSKFDRYRAQELIIKGEWLTKNAAILTLIAELISEKVCEFLEDESEDCHYMYSISSADDALGAVISSYRDMLASLPSYDAHDGTVALTYPRACKEHRTVVLVDSDQSKES